MRKPFIGGNWKMNTSRASGSDLARAVSDGVNSVRAAVDVAIFPPFPYLMTIRQILRERNSAVKLGAQDCYFEPDGAFTGEVSIAMLKDIGVDVVLAGHSERRHVLNETDELTNKKVKAILDAGFECILCCGEKLEQRVANLTDTVNERQIRAGLAGVPGECLSRLTIAYEPVWAIGTGKVATPEDAQTAQVRIRAVLAQLYGQEAADRIRIQYGGSLKPNNAREIFKQPDVDGGLIGGASLKSDEFVAICRAAAESVPA